MAILGSLVSRQGQFLSGMHLALGLAGGAYLAGVLLTLWGMGHVSGPALTSTPRRNRSCGERAFRRTCRIMRRETMRQKEGARMSCAPDCA